MAGRHGTITKIAASVALLLAIGWGFYLAFDAGLIRFNTPSSDRFPVQGIDVSHHQGEIDWPKVARSGYAGFAYIKATEGGDFKDARFQKNWKESRQAGIATGAYHFFTFCRPGKDQARNFLETVPGDPANLPFAVDLEFGGNCDAIPSVANLAAELRDFVTEVQSVHHQKPVFYVTGEFYRHYMEGNPGMFPSHHLWLRNIFHEPSQKRCEKWQFWQFSHRGRIGGIEGPVDLNVFCAVRKGISQLVKAGL
ncbi:MAG: glycoside hydrolase family 25 protein [Salaquimonas sp.]|nr:glycoside hydrolase family 25 protein [Salaquimonas sp.]